MSTVTIEQLAVPDKTARWNRFDSPWLNPKLIGGFLLVMFVVLLGVVGPLFWDITLARVASSPLTLPAVRVKDPPVFFPPPVAAHPLGSESNGRDILALLMAAAPGSLRVGLIA